MALGPMGSRGKTEFALAPGCRRGGHVGRSVQEPGSRLGTEDSAKNWLLPRRTHFPPAWIPAGSLRDQFHQQIPVTLPQGAGQGTACTITRFQPGGRLTGPDARDPECKVCPQSHGPAEAGAPCGDRLPLRKEDPEENSKVSIHPPGSKPLPGTRQPCQHGREWRAWSLAEDGEG